MGVALTGGSPSMGRLLSPESAPASSTRGTHTARFSLTSCLSPFTAPVCRGCRQFHGSVNPSFTAPMVKAILEGRKVQFREPPEDRFAVPSLASALTLATRRIGLPLDKPLDRFHKSFYQSASQARSLPLRGPLPLLIKRSYEARQAGNKKRARPSMSRSGQEGQKATTDNLYYQKVLQ